MLAAMVVIFNSSCSPEPEAEIAAYGDSVTWGYGALPGGWVTRLEARTGYEFTNLAVPGETAEGGSKRIARALKTAPNAATVLLIHGGNDWVSIFRGDPCKSGCDPATVDHKYEHVRLHLRKMRNRIAESGKKVVFGQYWPTSPETCSRYKPENFVRYQEHRSYLNAKIQMVADEYGDAIVTHDDMYEMDDTGANFFDCLHPSAKGYDLIAERWLQDYEIWKPESKWMFEF